MAKRAGKLFTKLPEGVGRTEWLPRVRATRAEREQVEQNASDCGLSIGEYMRLASLGRKTRSRTAAVIINELRLIGNDVKQIHAVAPHVDRARLSLLLDQIIEAIKHVGEGRVGE